MSKVHKQRKLADRGKKVPIDADVGSVEIGRLVEEARLAARTLAPGELMHVINEIIAAPRPIAFRVLHMIAADLKQDALPILLGCAGSTDDELAAASIQALGEVKSEAVAKALAEIAVTNERKKLKKEARRSLFRLKSAGIAVPDYAPPEAQRDTKAPERTLWKAYMSNHDRRGDQVFEAGADGALGRFEIFRVLVNDANGIKGFRMLDSSKKAWQKILSEIEKEPGFTYVEIPIDYFRYRIKLGYEVALARGGKKLDNFERWKSFIATPERDYERHPIYDEISLVELKWNPQFLEESPRLLKNDEFLHWVIPPETIKPFIEQLAAIKEGKVHLPPWVELEREEKVINEALNQLFSPEARIRYKARLEDLAYIFAHTDRLLDAKRALAAALAFDVESGVSPTEHPLARELFFEAVDFSLGADEKGGAKKLVTDIADLAPFILTDKAE